MRSSKNTPLDRRLQTYSLDEIVAEQTIALADRARNEPHDLYGRHVENAPDIDDILRRYLGFEASSELRDIEHRKKLIEFLEHFRATGKPK